MIMRRKQNVGIKNCEYGLPLKIIINAKMRIEIRFIFSMFRLLFSAFFEKLEIGRVPGATRNAVNCWKFLFHISIFHFLKNKNWNYKKFAEFRVPPETLSISCNFIFVFWENENKNAKN